MRSKKTTSSSSPLRSSESRKKYTEEELIALGEEFLEFCKREDVFASSKFASEKGHSYQWWKYLVSQYPEPLLAYNNRGKELIGLRLLGSACHSSPLWVLKTLVPKFLTEVKEAAAEEKDSEFEHVKRVKELEHELRMKEEEYKKNLEKVHEEEAGKQVDKLADIIKSLREQE